MPLFTRETAASMSAKGNALRWSRFHAAKAAARLPATPDTPPLPPEPEVPDGFHEKRILRVRAQLDRLDAMLLTEDDPQRIDRLASAQLRLSEQERVLAGRPLPGSRKPGPAPRPGPGSAGPVLAPRPMTQPAAPTVQPIPSAPDPPLPGDVTP